MDMKILFVPFSYRYTKWLYLRVRNCAQARAIENECYVAIAGALVICQKLIIWIFNMHNLQCLHHLILLSPTNGIKAEATPNTEMTLIVDVDLDLIAELNRYGSVKNMRDSRTDLYDLKLK